MRNRSPWFHLGVGAAVVIVTGFAFTPFPRTMPHPEDLSPLAYVVANILAWIALLRISDRKLRLRYLFIPAFALLALGEEISYGVEINWLPPLYWEPYDLNVYDLHNFIPAFLRIVARSIGIREWNWAMFYRFLLFDFLVLILAVAIGWISGTRSKRKSQSPNAALLSKLAAASFLLPILPAATLIALPSDLRGGLLLGFSAARLALLAFLLLASGTFLIGFFLLREPTRNERLRAVIDKFKSKPGVGRIVTVVILVILTLGLGYQLWAPVNPLPGRTEIHERLSPIILWITGQAALLLFAFKRWGSSQGSAKNKSALGPIAFISGNPAYIYAFLAIGLIAFGQLLDRGVIPLNDYLKTPNFWLTNWSRWIEELFEMTAAFELGIASFFFPVSKRK